MNEQFILVQDNDSHWYVIPAKRQGGWFEFLDLDPDDPKSWDVPNWADFVNGPSDRVVFEKYEIK